MTIESTLEYPRRGGVRSALRSAVRIARPLRAFVARSLTPVYGALLETPPGRWLHRRLWTNLEFSSTDVRLSRGEQGIDRFSIVWLSDLHAGLFMTEQDLFSLAQRVAALEPDVVCLGGDLVNTHAYQLHFYDRALKVLRPRLGIFAVPGNHEHYYLRGLEGWQDYLERRGVRVLVNRGVRLERDGASLWMCGVDELEEGMPDLGAALEGRRGDEPAVLLSHHPDVFPEASRQNVDLQLSGHTHGGQIRFFGWAPVTHSVHGLYDGLYQRDRSHLYVGRGAGVTFVPIRIGTRSEVPLLRLRTGAGSPC